MASFEIKKINLISIIVITLKILFEKKGSILYKITVVMLRTININLKYFPRLLNLLFF